MRVIFDSLKKKLNSFFIKEEAKINQELQQEKQEQIITKSEDKQIIKQQKADATEVMKSNQEEIKENKEIKEVKKEESKETKKQLKKSVELKESIASTEEEMKEEPGEQFKEKKYLPKLTLTTKLKKTILRKAVIKEEDVETLLWDFYLELLEADVSVTVAEKIIQEIKQQLVGKEITSSQDIKKISMQAIKKSVEDILLQPNFNLIEKIKTKQKKPFVIMLVGPNGHGKTTTIAKLTYLLNNNNFSTVLAAADTFRAASIEQLEKWAEKTNSKVIKHQYGADPAAVCFDAIKHAEAKQVDVVLIDTAGRSELNTNLMEQLRKIVKIAKPDLKIYVGEALAGNAAVEEAKKFNGIINIDGIIMTKTDADVKGGSILSISYETKKPILFMGTGQNLSDLKEFKKQWFIKKLFEE